MRSTTRFAEIFGWMAFMAAMVIVTFAPERRWWAIPLYVTAGVLFVVAILRKRARTIVR